MITAQGLNDLLDTYLGTRSKESNWYVGYISATNFTGISASDVPSSHGGWEEFIDYAEAARPELVFGNTSSGVDTNPAKVEMTPNSDADVVGFFLTTAPAKSATTGSMPFVALFDDGTRSVKDSQIEQFTINVTAVNG